MAWRCTHLEHGALVAQVHLLEDILGVPGDAFEVLQPPGVGQAVEIDQLADLRPVNDVMDEIGADEAGPASD